MNDDKKLNEIDLYNLEILLNRYLVYQAEKLDELGDPHYALNPTNIEKKYQKIINKIRLLLGEDEYEL